MTFHELYSNYYSRAFRFVKSYVIDPAVAEDIVAESMIVVWRRFDPSREGSILPFLFTILRNRSLDYLKSSRQRLCSSCSDKDPELLDLDIRLNSLAETVESSLFSAEISEIVVHTLAKMPEKTREIFKCSRFEGKTYLEISQLFGITDKGVEYHMSTAIKMLREALKDYLPLFAPIV